MSSAGLARALGEAIESSNAQLLKALLGVGPQGYIATSGLAFRSTPGKAKKSPGIAIAGEIASQYERYQQGMAQQDMETAWTAINALLNAFFRLIATLTNSRWTCPTLVMLLGQHRSLSVAVDSRSASKHVKTEESARQLSKAFSICVGDRNLDPQQSRKWATYEVVCLLFRTYFRLKSLGLCRNILRALNAADLPPFEQFPRAQRVNFRYYVGALSFLNEDYQKAETDLTYALLNCHSDRKHNQAMILRYLIPCGMLAGKLPKRRMVLDFPTLAGLYLPFIDAIKSGNVQAYDDALATPLFERTLVNTGTYLAIERAREICLRGLIKRVHRCKGNSSRIALVDIHHAMLFVGAKLDLLEIEWLVASQIAKGYIKGYISHPHMTVVLSTHDPFPDLASILLSS